MTNVLKKIALFNKYITVDRECVLSQQHTFIVEDMPQYFNDV